MVCRELVATVASGVKGTITGRYSYAAVLQAYCLTRGEASLQSTAAESHPCLSARLVAAGRTDYHGVPCASQQTKEVEHGKRLGLPGSVRHERCDIATRSGRATLSVRFCRWASGSRGIPFPRI